MKNKMLFTRLGAASVIAALGLVACGDDSSNSPVIPNEILSSESSEPASSESALPASSGNAQPASSATTLSSGSQPTSSESSQPTSSANEPPTSSNSNPSSSNSNPVSSSSIAGSSSSDVNGSSSSAVNSSSSRSKEQCVPMPHVDPGAGISYQIPICSQEEEGSTQPDCKTDDVYVCLEGRWTNIQTETCRHITDVGDRMKPHSCDIEFEVAMDCAKNYYMMCAGGIWLNATGCDITKEKCGFDEYKLCMDYNLREYCSDDWLDEPCQEGKSRDLRKYDNENSTSYSLVNYICVDGKWVDRMSYYNCPEGRDCGSGGFQDCWESDIIGTTCDERNPETSWISKDGCDFQCRDGKYEFLPPPTR